MKTITKIEANRSAAVHRKQSGNPPASFMMLALLEQKQKFVLDCKTFYRLAAWAG